MRKACLFLLLFAGFVFCSSPVSAQVFEKTNSLNLGVDISPLNYMVSERKRAFNTGFFAQFKPYRFLSFNSSFFIHHVEDVRGQGYPNLTHYASQGHCAKLGFDISLRLNRKKTSRLFMGYQKAWVNYKESGNFILDNGYWGHHEKIFNTGYRDYLVTEFIAGFQFENKHWVFRPQVYNIFFKDDRKISYHDNIVQGYRSPFIPGFGFKRGGINLLFLYKIN